MRFAVVEDRDHLVATQPGRHEAFEDDGFAWPHRDGLKWAPLRGWCGDIAEATVRRY